MNYFDEYKRSNTQQRLELYLQFPDLRSEFDHIEKTETKSQSSAFEQIVIVPQKEQKKQSVLVRLKNYCFSFLA